MTRRLLTGNEAAAWGARLAGVDYVPAFPITPQTEIIEVLSRWIDTGEIPVRMTQMDSEHSMLTAAGTAAATGVRVFTATSSQGLLYGLEMLYALAGWRCPLVLVNVSRALAAPITLEPDHNDVLAARDTGFLQIHCATCQEVLDGVLLAYRWAEDARVRLPVIVNLDGFYLSFTREPVTLPEAGRVGDFLPAFAHQGIRFKGGEPRAQASAVLGGGAYSYFRYETHLAALGSLAVFEEAAREFQGACGRAFEPVEAAHCEDAEIVFVMMGAFATKARQAVERMREAGRRVGLARPRLFRPFPEQRLVELLRGARGVAVIDQNLSTGRGGILHGEVNAALHQAGIRDAVVAGYAGGLGGRDIPLAEFVAIADEVEAAASRGENPPPRLLYTQGELEQTRTLQQVALAQPLDEEVRPA